MQKTSFASVFGLWAVGLGAAAQFGKVSVTFDMLETVYGRSGAALGFAVSLVGFVGILFGVTAGLIVARAGYRRAILAALMLGAVMSVYQATLPALPLFLISRAVEGASHLAIVVAAPTLIAQLSLPRHRGFTLSLWSTFFGVAFAVLVWAGLTLARVYGVASLFGAHGAYMALMAAVILVLLPRDVIGPGHDRISLPSVVREHVHIYRSPWLSAPALGWLCYAASWVAILTVMPRYLPDATRDAVVGLMPLAGIASSMTLGVWLLRRMPAIGVVQIGFAASAAGAVLIWAMPTSGTTYLILALALGLIQGGSFSAIPQLNADPSDQARANGALAQMGNVGTTTGTPILVAMVASGGIGGFLLFALALYFSGFCLHLALSRRRRGVSA